MPSLGADMEAGTLIEWLKRPGDRVARGDIVAVVETQKGAIEIEIFEEGVIRELLVRPGAKVPVGTPLATIGEPAAATPPALEVAAAAAPAPAPEPAAGRSRVSPAARRLARERGIDLAGLAGSGPGGAVVSADLPRAVERKPGRLDAAAMRQAIAAAMARSKREIPHYYLTATIDLTPALSWLEARNAARPPPERLLAAILFVKATALALRKFPEFSGHFTAEGFRPSPAIHVGMAVSLRGGGLVAPALHDADRRPLDALMADFRDLVTRARAGTLRSSELSDPTITVSSLGERGVDALIGVITPPQVALVGFGTPAPRPWLVDGAVVARTVAVVSLAGDHRVSDGHRGALFLRDIDARLQTPEAL